jgi:hypothetical protein
VAEASPVFSALSRGGPETPRARSSEGEHKRAFKRLVEYLDAAKCIEKSITTFENSAKCPFRALTFDGLTHVICDFSDCGKRVCPRDCRQAFAYLDLSTLNITTEEPLVDYQKVYIGCIFEEKNGIESPKQPKLV